jgi:hypothetical protein
MAGIKGVGGQNKKSTEQKKLEGTYRKDRDKPKRKNEKLISSINDLYELSLAIKNDLYSKHNEENGFNSKMIKDYLETLKCLNAISNNTDEEEPEETTDIVSKLIKKNEK